MFSQRFPGARESSSTFYWVGWFLYYGRYFFGWEVPRKYFELGYLIVVFIGKYFVLFVSDGSTKEVSRKYQGSIKEVPREYQGSIKEVPGKYQ